MSGVVRHTCEVDASQRIVSTRRRRYLNFVCKITDPLVRLIGNENIFCILYMASFPAGEFRQMTMDTKIS
jgi:hypothetical protein